MYREPPDSEYDSGWRFFSGPEPEGYEDDPANFGLYDVNTVANYDPEIVPLLDAPAGSAFERAGASGGLIAADFQPPDDELRASSGL